MAKINKINIAGADQQKNHIINGALTIWQRGTSAAINSNYLADRMFTFRQTGSAGSTVSQQPITSWTINNTPPKYCLRLQRDSGNSVTTAIECIQAFETINSLSLAGKRVTFSFYARAGANFSGTHVRFYVGTGTGIDQGVVAAWNGGATPLNTTDTITTSWKRFSVTGLIPTGTTQIRWDINYTPIGTAGAADYIEIAQIMLNEGVVAAPFQAAGANLAAEIIMCQRYYSKSFYIDQTPTANSANWLYRLVGVQNVASGQLMEATQMFAVEMRANPVVTLYGGENIGGAGSIYVNGTARTASVDRVWKSGFSRINNTSGVTWNTTDGIIYNYTADAEL